MTIGRLSIHGGQWFTFEKIKGICGCVILTTPIVGFTWHDRRCVCDECAHYVCKCPSRCDECEMEAKSRVHCDECLVYLCVYCAQLHSCKDFQ